MVTVPIYFWGPMRKALKQHGATGVGGDTFWTICNEITEKAKVI